jgi:RES domain-containing protein
MRLRSAVESNTPPDFLYVAISAGRYNPDGVEALYWSEEESVAMLEYRRYHQGSQTYETFFCRYVLNVIDFNDPDVVSALGLRPSDLCARWRTAPRPTKCQILGKAISFQRRFAAIRYPSEAARVAGESGFNYVIFRASIRSPYFVKVETDPGIAIQRWP